MKTAIERLDFLTASLKVLILIFFVAGCFSAGNIAAPSPTAEVRNGSVGSAHETSDLEGLARLWEKRTKNAVSDYPIGPGDLVEITVPAMEEIKDRNVRVAADGTILLPLIGSVQAAGLTETELVEQLRARLKEYLRNPHISIFVKEYNSRQVAVLGAVKQPGLYTLSSGSENILDMISRAGGILPDAEPEIQLIPTEPLKPDAAKEVVSTLSVGLPAKNRAGPILRKTEPILIDVTELSYGGYQRYLSLPVRPGDTIMVPGGAQILVDGWVDKPGAFKMSPGLTVSGAVAAAGGATYAGDTSTVTVIRPDRGGKKISLVADLDKIKTGDTPDITLRGGDIVQVSSSKAKLVPYGIYQFFKEIMRVGVGANVR